MNYLSPENLGITGRDRVLVVQPHPDDEGLKKGLFDYLC